MEQFLILTGAVVMGIAGWAVILLAIYGCVLCSNRLTHLVLDAYGGWETFVRSLPQVVLGATRKPEGIQMTTLHAAAQQALDETRRIAREVFKDSRNHTHDAIEFFYSEMSESLRSALAQQDSSCVCPKCQGKGRIYMGCDSWIHCETCNTTGKVHAAQPACKQDLPVETEQERYVRMCPDIECGRKKRCTRMVGVSCMSRADIAPAAQPVQGEPPQTRYQEVRDALEQLMAWQVKNVHVWHNSSYDNAQEVLNKHDAATPSTPQTDTRKVIEQMVEALTVEEAACAYEHIEVPEHLKTAIQAGQKWLEENK